MKKIFTLFLAALVSIVGLTACSQQKEASDTLTVGATAVPHAEILEHVKPILAKEGVKLNVKVFQDYVLP
ncbi:MAG: MetQ/NlpA family ABC transporter substrate-binding protein, partial [Thermoactinomyces sp.]